MSAKTILLAAIIGMGGVAIGSGLASIFKTPHTVTPRYVPMSSAGVQQPDTTLAAAHDEIDDEQAALAESELEELALQAIDELAAHPDDPQNPAGLPGVTDEKLAELPVEDVQELMELALPYAEQNADQPRYLFALGRAAWIHGDNDFARELLLKASELGSPAADAYLARMSEDAAETDTFLQKAVEGGFSPARAWQKEVQAARQPDFSAFSWPELIQSFYEGTSSGFAQEPLLPLGYVMSISSEISNQGVLFFLENPRNFVQELDPNLTFHAEKQLMTNSKAMGDAMNAGMDLFKRVVTGMADVRRNGGTVQEELQAVNKAFYGVDQNQEANKQGARYVTLVEVKQWGTQDARMLALLYNEHPEQFRKIYQGMRRFVKQEIQ